MAKSSPAVSESVSLDAPSYSDRPLVSIVTPSLNQAEFLEDTIRSVVAQDYANLEYLVLDGGSTDDSQEIIRRYEERLAYWASAPDAGQADAINRGWRLAQGEILAYLNADDQYTPGAVTRVVDFFQRHPNVGMVYGPCYAMLSGTARYLYHPPGFQLRRLLVDNFIPQPSVFIRRTVLERIGLLDPSLRYCLDYDLWLRAALAGISVQRCTGGALACFRIWSGSKTSGDPAGWVAERLRVLERAFASEAAPRGVRELKAYAQAKAYLSVAYGMALSGDFQSVRPLLRQALAATPTIVLDPPFLRLVVTILLGRHGSQFVRQVKWTVWSWLAR